MSHRTIQYQASDGKWYELEIWDIIDPLSDNNIKAENDELRAELSQWQCGAMTLDKYEAN